VNCQKNDSLLFNSKLYFLKIILLTKQGIHLFAICYANIQQPPKNTISLEIIEVQSKKTWIQEIPDRTNANYLTSFLCSRQINWCEEPNLSILRGAPNSFIATPPPQFSFHNTSNCLDFRWTMYPKFQNRENPT